MDTISFFLKKGFNSLKNVWLKSACVALCCLLITVAIDLLLLAILFAIFDVDNITVGLGNFAFAMSFNMIWLFSYPLLWSFLVVFLGQIRGGKLSVSQLFWGYKDAWRILCGNFLAGLCAVIPALLIIIVGAVLVVVLHASILMYNLFAIIGCFVFAYVFILFSQFPFIIFDDEDISSIGALKQSVRLMKGHVLQFFLLLILLLLIIALVTVLTLGIGLLFVLPYLNMVLAHYYENLSEAKEEAYSVDMIQE